ncbi:hypothetical protein WJX73_003863 [Symbiochloris irregularis]|uniref:Defective in cullin neddylation protein n=1 Tax=Symbiochloris irregularis TaxID=706552 RepID=A0AAW1Q1N8_9CHLO
MLCSRSEAGAARSDGAIVHITSASALPQAVAQSVKRSEYMPPKKKRAAAQTVKSSPMKRLRRGAKAKAAEDEPDKFTKFFNAYRSPGTEEIGPEGITKLCQDLGLDPANRKVLVLAWKLRAQRQGFFTREEFCRGMMDLGASDPQHLRRVLDSLEQGVISSSSQFQPFCVYAFKFCLTEPAQRIIDLETAAQMLSIAMAGCPHVEPFTQFLMQQADYKTVNMDQWTGFLRFSQDVKPDCSNFDEAQAWPLLLDNYVEWRRKLS